MKQITSVETNTPVPTTMHIVKCKIQVQKIKQAVIRNQKPNDFQCRKQGHQHIEKYSDNIIRQVINAQQERSGSTNETLSNVSMNRSFSRRFPINSHAALSTTEKSINNAENMTRNSMTQITLDSLSIKCYNSLASNKVNSRPTECFPLTYDLSRFKSRINRHILTAGSF